MPNSNTKHIAVMGARRTHTTLLHLQALLYKQPVLILEVVSDPLVYSQPYLFYYEVEYSGRFN